MDSNDNKGFSLLKLMAENELKRRKTNSKLSNQKISPNDANGIADVVKDLIYDQNLTIGGHSYTINAVTSEKTLKVDALDVDKDYWTEDDEQD
jgi:hypothetical protein